MGKLTNSEIIGIDFQDDVDSYPHRTNYANIKNRHNELVDTVAATTIGTTNAETTAARPYHTDLKTRLDQMGGNQNIVLSGLEVSAQSTPNMTVQISAGKAIAGGIPVESTSTTNTATFTAPTNKRYVVIVINSDNTIAGVLGSDVADPVLPSIASTQRPLAYFLLESSTTSITNGAITDMSVQGCLANGQWFFKIQDAVDAAARTNQNTQKNIKIFKGDYREEVDLSGVSNVALTGEEGVQIIRTSNAARCLLSANSSGNETSVTIIKDIKLNSDGRGGSVNNALFDYCDRLVLSGVSSDANASSSEPYKEIRIDNSDQVDIVLSDGADFVNWINESTCTLYKSDSEAVIRTDRDITNGDYFVRTGSVNLKTYVVDMGDWNMATTDTITIVIDPAPFDVDQIVNLKAMIYRDISGDEKAVFDLTGQQNAANAGPSGGIRATLNTLTDSITLRVYRTSGGFFGANSSSFTQTSFNRGKIFIDYLG